MQPSWKTKYLLRGLNADPGWEHHARVQRLCSHSEIHHAIGITRPHILTAAGKAQKPHVPCTHVCGREKEMEGGREKKERNNVTINQEMKT